MRNAIAAVATFAVVLHLAGCDREPGSGSSNPASDRVGVKTQAPAAAASPTADAGTAQKVLQDWREAMETHSFAQARAFFGNGGAASGMNETAFARAWGKYRIIDMTIGEGQAEGAAGSLYHAAPVTITGLTREGRPYHLSGTVTARRVNDVPGATPAQLRWHIDSTTLNP